MRMRWNAPASGAWICRASLADPVWLLPAASRQESPWKNGGGRTFEVASDSPGSAPASFNWRISIAEIAQPGPFSSFVGVERTLTLLQGGPLTLLVEGQERLLTLPFDKVSFSGDWFIESSVGSPAWVVNAMSRRDTHQHQVRQVKDGESLQAAAGEILLVISLGEKLRIGRALLSRFDAALLSQGGSVSAYAGEASGLLISISD